jgi:predicted nucleic acid-binding protein
MPESLAGLHPILVVDSWPALEWLKRRELGTTRFRQLLSRAQGSEATLLMSSINLGEIYYNCLIEWGEERADALLAEFRKLPLLIIHPREDDALAAARMKGRYRCSYADAFACILALEFSCPVIMGDRDFLKIDQDGTVNVEWWGA